VCHLIYIERNYFLSPRYRDLWNVLQIVNIGSGVSVLAVYGPNNYRRISGTRLVFMPPSYLIHRNAVPFSQLLLSFCIISAPYNIDVLRSDDVSLSYTTDSKTQKLTVLRLRFNVHTSGIQSLCYMFECHRIMIKWKIQTQKLEGQHMEYEFHQITIR